MPAAEVGSTANSYEILAKLATGGMAEIFLARGASAAGVERYVVLKRVLRERASDIHFVRMFLDEARLAAQLQHPNIAQVYDIGKLGDSFFFTMEYVHGETVRAMLQRSYTLVKPLPLGAVLAIASGAAAGLHHAHERSGLDGKPLGIVHRDVSPSNLMVSFEGNVKVVDFGVAKAAHRTQETRSGTVKGKIAYLSPEQCRGLEADRRSDVFSLGIVMWEMLTTERLYRRSSDFETMAAIVNEAVPPPSSRRGGIPPQLDAMVMRALSKTKEDRFQTGEELLEEIDRIAAATGSPLSPGSLAKVVRELFGPRPVPWVELREEHVVEHVTVTSEPIPPELAFPLAHSVDRQLARVLDLSVADSSHSVPALPTAPMRVVSPTAAITEVVLTATTTPTPTVPVVMPPTPMIQPTLIGMGPPPPIAGSQTGSVASYRPRLPLPRWLVILAPVVAVALIIMAIVAWSGPATSETIDAQEVVSVVVPEPPPPPAPEPPAPVAHVPEPVDAAPPRVTEPSVEVDAAPPRVVDRAVPEPSSAPPVRAVDDLAVDSHAADDARPALHPRPHVVTKDLSKWVDAARYNDVMAECAASAATAAQNALACTIAACHAHDAAKARKWIAAVPTGKRQRAVEACDAAHVELEPHAKPPEPHETHAKPPAQPDCYAHPMDCQR